MFRFFWTAALALFVFSAFPRGSSFALSQSSQIRWPNKRERGSYQAKIASTGKILWQIRWETTVTQEQGKSQIEVQEQGEGRPWRAKETQVWKKQILFEAGPLESAVRVRSVTGSHWTQDGKLINEMDFEADPALRRIYYTDTEAGRRPKTIELPWTPHSIPDELLFHWARMLPFQSAEGEKPPVIDCTLVVSPSRQFRIKAQVQGTEVVTTPAGTFSCYRVSLTPQLLGPLKALAPRMALWCRTDPPNYWVRYQGPVGGPGSPEAVIELVEFEQENR